MSSSSPWPVYQQSTAVPPHHQRLYSSACPGFFPNLQERPVERRPDLGPQSFPTWGRQTQGSPHMPLHHSAASSGFSTAANAGVPLPSHPPAPFSDHQFYLPPTA
uniref:Ids1 n=1 Tax=Arundo donax TaxID=35708 RepID=A0A0A9D1Q3_ARUDO